MHVSSPLCPSSRTSDSGCDSRARSLRHRQRTSAEGDFVPARNGGSAAVAIAASSRWAISRTVYESSLVFVAGDGEVESVRRIGKTAHERWPGFRLGFIPPCASGGRGVNRDPHRKARHAAVESAHRLEFVHVCHGRDSPGLSWRKNRSRHVPEVDPHVIAPEYEASSIAGEGQRTMAAQSPVPGQAINLVARPHIPETDGIVEAR